MILKIKPFVLFMCCEALSAGNLRTHSPRSCAFTNIDVQWQLVVRPGWIICFIFCYFLRDDKLFSREKPLRTSKVVNGIER